MIRGDKFAWPRNTSRWADLFQKIVPVNERDPKTAGTIFEIFCKYFFLTNPTVAGDYRNVWLGREAPLAVKRKLGLEKHDYGYDLILETVDGKFAVVQCKFTSKQSEKRLSWSGDKLSSWLAASSKADIRILFTNASGIDSATLRKAEETEFYAYTLSALLDLSSAGIQRILDGINRKPIKQARRLRPFSHQRQAIRKVLVGFKANSRGKLILPCGAGKTLTALWIKEQLKPKRTLVLVPSLSLLRQFKNDWKSQERRRSEYLCVCSESDIDRTRDTPESAIYEIGAKATTDAKEIRAFLKSRRECVIYATYQSSPRLAAALKGTGMSFDLAVCDEAHRTAGERISAFATIHDDKKIKVAKRIYMTATPRIVAEVVKDRLGEDQLKLLADMNDPTIYGPELYRMSFAEAIKAKVLVDYKIVAIGVTDSELQRAIRERRFARSGTTIEEVANNLALYKVMAKHGCTHPVTFHSSVRKAKDFAELSSDLYPKTPVFHVNGTQPTDERAQLLDQFKNARTSVITNARCLTEGIDIKAIDCVYFCDPRNSKIDIVQASGRAMRTFKDGGKRLGYIVVPIFHRHSGNVEEAIERSVYKNLVQVVRALADQDARLEEEIKTISYGIGERNQAKRHISINLTKAKLIELAGFENSLKKSIFSQVIRKAVIPWRPFERARDYVRTLGLRSSDEWKKYCSNKLPGYQQKPGDIPSAPHLAYRKEWKGFGDWIGTGRISDWYREYRPFKAARDFVRRLHLASQTEWTLYCTGKFKGKPPKPYDIPANPYGAYGDQFKSLGDWLGTGTIATRSRKYRPFLKARAYVRKLNLKDQYEWRLYCVGKLPKKGKKPADIPAVAHRTYGRQWKGYGDWLGTGVIASSKQVFRSFSRARSFVRKLGLKNYEEWRSYCKGGLKGKPEKPADIPSGPLQVYRKQFNGFGDWLGTRNTATKNRNFLSFEAARSYVKKLGLRNGKEWNEYCKLGKIPANIPRKPDQTYRGKGWLSFGDWLGTGRVATFLRKFRSFRHARDFARHLRLKGKSEWEAYCKGNLSNKVKPEDIPSSPDGAYRGQWKGWKDWLGVPALRYRSFTRARAFARKLQLKNYSEWREYCKGSTSIYPSKPDDIPANPGQYYGGEWRGASDWLGINLKDRFRNFKKARAFVRKLGLENYEGWRVYCRGELKNKPKKPADIPSGPGQVYGKKFKGFGDWLGTGNVAYRFRKCRPFFKAREYVRRLNLSGENEWRRYCKGELQHKSKKPDDIPATPNRVYRTEWKGMGDWLGTFRAAPFARKVRPFTKARAFARNLGLSSAIEWQNYCKGCNNMKPPKPVDIPAKPSRTYSKQGWKGYPDWLGYSE